MPSVLVLTSTDGSKCQKGEIHRGLLRVMARILGFVLVVSEDAPRDRILVGFHPNLPYLDGSV